MSGYLKGKHVVDPVLASIARGYKNAVFIGERTFPVMLTDKEGVCALTFGEIAFMGYDTERAVRTDSNILVCEKTGMLDLVLGEHDSTAPVDYRGQAESTFNEESKATRRTTNGANLRRELIAVRLAQNEEVYHTGHIEKLTASDRWTGGKGDPIGVTEVDMETIRTATGLHPNPMTMEADVMALLKFHPTIQAAIRASERKRITTEILQDLFQIEETVTGIPVSLPSTKTVIDKSSMPADIWGDNLTPHYVDKLQPGADSTDENEPSFGYTLHHKGMPVADKYDGASGEAKYCRYTGIYKVTVVDGSTGYLIVGISK